MTETAAVLDNLADQLEHLSPEMRKAAAWVLEHPLDISVSSIREVAQAAQVKPNTLVRLARSCGFDGYDDFREPFREQVRRGPANFQDRARWLQSLSHSGKLGGVYASMVSGAIENIENTFASTDALTLQAAADAIIQARRTWVLGVGLNYSLARNFSYLAGMALDNVQAIPANGNLAIDDVARALPGDILLAMTFKPYRSEVVDAVEIARRQGVTIIGISDSPASPVVAGSEHGFVVHTETPQFFTSIVAASALLESLIAFVIADADQTVIDNIQRFHERRHQLGIYREDQETSA
jgi:DNA-binding MurR/RpiR family transcriptional regulator